MVATVSNILVKGEESRKEGVMTIDWKETSVWAVSHFRKEKRGAGRRGSCLLSASWWSLGKMTSLLAWSGLGSSFSLGSWTLICIAFPYEAKVMALSWQGLSQAGAGRRRFNWPQILSEASNHHRSPLSPKVARGLWMHAGSVRGSKLLCRHVPKASPWLSPCSPL